MSLTDYRTLGRSGLVVSPLALGTMTFGTARWGSGEDVSREVFNAYVEAGGNFVDTADVYSSGRSEEMVGRFIAERGLRDRMVVATKAGFNTGRHPLSGGSGSGHLTRSLEASLTRLGTDYIDLFWLHVWDGVTPAEELLGTMARLISSGKVRYWGMSNAPAWYVAKLATLAAVRGLPGPVALQYFYSLANRGIEDEHIPMAREFGLGLLPWSPLAYGLLAGKYDRATVEAGAPRPGGLPRDAATDDAARPEQDKRLDGANPFGDTLFTERNWRIVDVLRRMADDTGQTPAKIALAWVSGRPTVTSTLMGVSRAAQLADNVTALQLRLTSEQLSELDAVSAPETGLIHGLLQPAMRRDAVFGADVVDYRGS